MLALCHGIPAGYRYENAKESGKYTNPQCPDHNHCKTGIEHLLVGGEGEFPNNTSIQAALQETVENDDTQGDREEEGEPQAHGTTIDGPQQLFTFPWFEGLFHRSVSFTK
ncbi:hypothetical protein DSECCO2_484360 [anaerobic digester metagenome]